MNCGRRQTNTESARGGSSEDRLAVRTRLLADNRLALERTARFWVSDPYDADDLLQNVCLFILRHDAVPEEASVFCAWSRRTIRNFALHHFRTRRRAKEIALGTLTPRLEFDCIGFDSEPPQEVARLRALRQCLAMLDNEPRDLLMRCYVDGETSLAAGRRLGKSAAAIRQSLLRIRSSLRRAVGRALIRDDVAATKQRNLYA